MNKITSVICFILITIFSLSSYAGEVSGAKAEAKVQSAIDETIGFLNNSKDLDNSAIESKFDELLNKYFDLDYISKASLGRYWKKATDAQKEEYQKAFKNNIVKVYSMRFKEYDNQTIKILKSSVRGRHDVIVFSELVSSDESTPPLEIDWRIRVDRDGSYNIIDFSVAGVSTLITQRNEYSSIIEKNGGDISALIKELNNFVSK